MTGCSCGGGVEYLLSMGDWTWLCFACKGVTRHPLATDRPRHTHSDPRTLSDWRTTVSDREHLIATVAAAIAEHEAEVARLLSPPPSIMPQGFTTDSHPVSSIMPEGFTTDSHPVEAQR